MLGILAAEYRDVGFDKPEQFGHHGQHSGEMARPIATAKPLAARSGLNSHARSLPIHEGTSGSEHGVHIQGPQHFQVLFQIPGIGFKILIRTKLRRVDENGNHDLAQAAARFHQTQVPLVKGPHGGNQHQGIVLL